MLPMLRNRKEGSASGPPEVIEREPDEGAEIDLLDAVADDQLSAIEKKDKELLKDALSALVAHIQTQDMEQDAGVEAGLV